MSVLCILKQENEGLVRVMERDSHQSVLSLRLLAENSSCSCDVDSIYWSGCSCIRRAGSQLERGLVAIVCDSSIPCASSNLLIGSSNKIGTSSGIEHVRTPARADNFVPSSAINTLCPNHTLLCVIV